MLTIYGVGEKGLTQLPADALEGGDHNVLWLDLFNPDRHEEHAVQTRLNIEVPTREEMKEIEISSRLYEENGAVYMTASIMTNADTPMPETTDVTFILAQGRVVTVRYAQPLPFALYAQRISKNLVTCSRGEQVFLGLMDGIVDRLADLLERAGMEIDVMSNKIFRPKLVAGEKPMRTRDFDKILEQVGRTGDLVSKVRESLVTIARVVGYVSGFEGAGSEKLPKDVKPHLKSILRDVQQLTDHASFLSNKIGFVLEAVTGLITIEQNNIIKLFSVVSVALMPPTLIASVYGMNFQVMPELSQTWGYPVALAMMLVSAFVPFIYFRQRGWL